ncbi:MAG: YgjV family protein [Clostridia bacterium]
MEATISYIVGTIALMVWIFSIQVKGKEKILQTQMIANILYSIQYILIGAITAGSMNLVSALRSYVFYKKQKNTNMVSTTWLFVFITIILVIAVITCRDFMSLIPIIITILYTYATWQKNTKVIRIIFLLAACIWIYYNFYIGAYVAIIGNGLEIISSIISMIRFDKKKKISN